MRALTSDDALHACRLLGLSYKPDLRAADGLWEARCPLCVLHTEGLALSIRERAGGRSVMLTCRNGCDAERIAAKLAAVFEGSALATGRIVAESFDAITTDRTSWLWEDRVPLRAPTLLVGREKLGKSTLTCQLAARVSRGTLPGDLQGTPSSVLMLSYEDSAGSTIKPRLLAAGADPERIFQATAQRDGIADLVSLPDDVDAIGAIVAEHECRLVIVDPFSASLGSDVNSHRDQDMRRAIASLAQLADAQNAALVLVAHFNKSPTGDSLTRVLGSRALTAASRSVLVFGRAPDSEDRSPDRVLAHAACNLGAEAPSLSCRIEPAVIEAEIGSVETSCLVLLGESDARADDLLTTRTDDERTDRDVATDWLCDELSTGEWRPAAEIKVAAKIAGIAERTLHRARVGLGVEDRREGYPARSEWRLPVVPQGVGTTVSARGGATGTNRTVEPKETDRTERSCQVPSGGTTGPRRAPLASALLGRIGEPA